MLRVERLQIGGLPPLSFEVADGECLAVEGASGAGKTLLLRAIADLDPAAGRCHPRRRGAARDDRRTSGAGACAIARPSRPGGRDTPRGCFLRHVASARLDRLMQSLDLDEALLDRPVATAVDRRASAPRIGARAARRTEGAPARRADRCARPAVHGARPRSSSAFSSCRGAASCSSATITRRSSAWRTRACCCSKATAAPTARGAREP